jgi:hypothetical protein
MALRAGTTNLGEFDVPYTIQIPISGQPISSSLYGIPVRNAIVNMDLRISALEASAQKLVKRGRRTTNTSTFTTTETPTLRIDDIPVVAGGAYRIMTSQLAVGSSVADGPGLIRIRGVFSGATGTPATISSTQFGAIRIWQDSSTQINTGAISCFYFAASSGYLSLIITAVRPSGTGNLTFFGAGGDAYDLTVEFAGADPGDTGVIL